MNWFKDRGLDGRFLQFYAITVMMIIITAALVIGVMLAIDAGAPLQAIEGLPIAVLYLLFAGSVGSLLWIIPAAALFGSAFRRERRQAGVSQSASFAALVMTAGTGVMFVLLTESDMLPVIIFAPLALFAAPYVARKIYRDGAEQR
ncbi:hypothetical protein [Paracoccus zhejiangensis]|uniref:Uncharacterized protein n=1 Tax=Paracoccus zhejiangensis TaxID=1077935 RepID=A0A2H5EVX0_9RHOB|nr:hypothetical protein [Paracoccus zhejiangensis]AUH63456.1 hypothetical protein CX676_04145 [Paracoccus zhejiangensis]